MDQTPFLHLALSALVTLSFLVGYRLGDRHGYYQAEGAKDREPVKAEGTYTARWRVRRSRAYRLKARLTLLAALAFLVLSILLTWNLLT